MGLTCSCGPFGLDSRRLREAYHCKWIPLPRQYGILKSAFSGFSQASKWRKKNTQTFIFEGDLITRLMTEKRKEKRLFHNRTTSFLVFICVCLRLWFRDWFKNSLLDGEVLRWNAVTINELGKLSVHYPGAVLEFCGRRRISKPVGGECGCR